MAKGEIKQFWATKQHDLRKLWILFDKFVIYIIIIWHHFHMYPSPFFSMFLLPRHDRDG